MFRVTARDDMSNTALFSSFSVFIRAFFLSIVVLPLHERVFLFFFPFHAVVEKDWRAGYEVLHYLVVNLPGFFGAIQTSWMVVEYNQENPRT